MNDKKKLNEALWKKAIGYTSTESVDELVSDGGSLTLNKQKVTTKEVPADMTALKLLIEQSQDELETLSDSELEAEKCRLLGLLADAQHLTHEDETYGIQDSQSEFTLLKTKSTSCQIGECTSKTTTAVKLCDSGINSRLHICKNCAKKLGKLLLKE